MKKIKLLLAAMAAMVAGGAYAQTDAEYADANASIQANGVYKIYTKSDGSSTGETKYYLKTDGYLTDDASAAGQFTFDLQRIFGGHRMAGYRINKFTNGGAQNNTFSGDALKKIITTSQNRVDWEAQVFYKNGDNYAIRSTNATSSNWGASAFWTVVADNDDDGLPNATYTVSDVPYVWQLEQVTPGDYSDMTAKWIVNYEPNSSAKEAGWFVTQGTKMGNWDGHNFSNSVAEFYRRAGGGISQTVNDLPSGYYTFTAIASARANTGGTISVNDIHKDIVALDINSTTEANTQFQNGNGVNTIDFTLDATSNVTFALTAGNTGDAWTVYRCFYLTYNSEPALLRKSLAAVKATAQTALNNAEYDAVTGYERTQLVASVAKTVDESQAPSVVMAAYNALIDEINTNLSEFTAAPPYYTLLATENTKAETDFGLPAQTTTSQSAKDAYHAQMVAEYNYVTTNYNTAIDLGSWTTENAGDMTGQHWDGGSTSYNEQKEGWSSSTAWTTSYSQDIELPAGDYVFKVAGRHSQYSVLTLNVKNGETVLGTVNDFPIGDRGRGINTSGETDFSDAGTYARGGDGGGWQWRYVPFTINEESANITISVEGSNPESKQYQWVSFCNYTVQSKPSVAASRVAYNQSKALAQAALENATYTNVGGTDRSNLVTEVGLTPEETIEWYDTHKSLLDGYTATFTAGVASWNNYTNSRPAATLAKTEADLISTSIYTGLSYTDPTTADEAAARVNEYQAVRVATANYVSTNYKYSLTSKIGDFSTWGATAKYTDGEGEHDDTPQTNSDQHWSATTRYYYEQGSHGWAASNGFSCTYTKTATLPAGNYVLKVAARASGGVTGSIEATATANTVALPNAGASSKGIDTSGAANFGDGTFANSNNGYGWQWRFLPFTLAEGGSVTITIQESTTATNNWFSLADAELLSDEDKTTKVTLDDSDDMASTISSNDGKLATVTLNREIKVGYNTVCLPFDLTAVQVQALFGASSVVYAYSEESGDANAATITFTTVGAGTINANKPVIVKATAASENNEIAGVTIEDPSGTPEVPGTNFDFVGVYNGITIPTGDYFIGNGKLFKSKGSTNIKPFRAYIHDKSGAGVKPLLFIDDIETSIEEINGEDMENGLIYNLAGQRIQKMQKGINIVNGKKILK